MRPAVALEDVLITDRFIWRNQRAPDLRAENDALHSIAQVLQEPEHALDHFAALAHRLCDAGSAGLCTYDSAAQDSEAFRMVAIRGALEKCVGLTFPRRECPCAVALDSGTPQLFDRPWRFFSALQSCQPRVMEALVVPILPRRVPWGTFWVMHHDEGQLFDSEDLRVMTSLARFMESAVVLVDMPSGPFKPQKPVTGLVSQGQDCDTQSQSTAER